MDIRHLVECMVALDMGIIPFDRNLKESFETLSKEDTKIAKRKFRKLKKKALKFRNSRRLEKNKLKYSDAKGSLLKTLVVQFFINEVKKRLSQ